MVGAMVVGVVDSMKSMLGNETSHSHHPSTSSPSGHHHPLSLTADPKDGSEVREGLTDDDIAAIFAINAKAKLGSVAPRVLEPLISLTLSEDFGEVLHASKYIRELVWCTSINYPRVQFQALWALANLCQTRIVRSETGSGAVSDGHDSGSSGGCGGGGAAAGGGGSAGSSRSNANHHRASTRGSTRGSTGGGQGLGYDEHMQRLLSLAAEQKLPLKEGDDLGEKFRELIVSTDYIMRSADDDANETVGAAIRETTDNRSGGGNNGNGDGGGYRESEGGSGDPAGVRRRRHSNHVSDRNYDDLDEDHLDHDGDEDSDYEGDYDKARKLGGSSGGNGGDLDGGAGASYDNGKSKGEKV
jgi:hypothetical protein